MKMFRKKCPYCGRKVNKNFEFCPYCGSNLSSKTEKEDYGLLGKDDYIDERDFLGFGGNFLEKMFTNLMKVLEKQFRDLSDFGPQKKPSSNLNIKFFINGKRVPISDFSDEEEPEEEKPKNLPPRKISKEKIEKLIKFPKKEPVSKVRRLGGKIIYSLEVPGVENLDDVFINQLDNSIEIKALSKDKVYSKTININLPILGYRLSKGNLILELDGR